MTILGAVHLAQNSSDFLFYNYIKDMKGKLHWSVVTQFLDRCTIPEGVTKISEDTMVCAIVEKTIKREQILAGISSVIDGKCFCFLPPENASLKDYLEEMTESELNDY